MTSFEQFCSRCKMRHDSGDRIQVRYEHSNGETYDTWVSGEEVLHRLRSEKAQERLERLSDVDWETLRQSRESLPGKVRDRLEEEARRRLSDTVDDWLGGNVIGDALADAVSGRAAGNDLQDEKMIRWEKRVHDAAFRAVVLELAWINLRGSFPPEKETGPDDWV